MAVDALVRALNHPLHDVRILASLARGEANDVRAVPVLLEALQQGDVKVCRNAIRALGCVGDVTVAPHLIGYLRHHLYDARHLISEALARLGDAVVPILDETLQERCGSTTLCG